jgi:hypothetical protein
MLSVAACAMLALSAVGCGRFSQTVRAQNLEGAMPYTVGTGQWDPNCPPGMDAYGTGFGGAPCAVRFRVPGDFVYPPPGDAPATVVYPYYTHKGPDCFFHGGR